MITSLLHASCSPSSVGTAAACRRSRCRSVSTSASTSHTPTLEHLNISRRVALGCVSAAGPILGGSFPALSQPQPVDLSYPASASTAEQCWSLLSRYPPGAAYAQTGPLTPLELPKLEHTCTSCFPACVGDKCLLSIEVTYPKGGSLLGMSPPYPLAIFSGGFTISSAAYKSTAQRLASWGYTVVRYNTRDALPDVLDDITCVRLQRELIDWAATHPLMRRLADTKRVYAAGHSRGAKLAALTAVVDPRVAALFLMDPVDVTQYAPLSDRFPSAASALASVAQSGRFLPVAVVGSGQAGDCAPRFNNYRSFYQAAPSVAWEVLLPGAGHFQYLDSTTALQRAVCGNALGGGPDDAAVRSISQAALVAWGEALVKPPGTDVLSCLAARCSSLGLPPNAAAAADLASRTEKGRGSSWLATAAGMSGTGMHWQQQSHHVKQQSVQQDMQSSAMPGSQQSTQQQQQQHNVPEQLPADQSWVRQQQQQQQQSLAALPRVQTRQEVWLASHAPSPGRLQQLKADLERLLVTISYQSSAMVEVQTQFRDFG